MLKRKYNRIFILLNGINEGLSENINGSCDIEIINGKGRLYAYVGGMGRLKEKERTLYLISAGIKGSLAVPAGNLGIKGTNAVLETSFDPDDMFGSGVAVEDINTAAVWNRADGPARSVLEGFVSHKIVWLKNLEIYGEEKPVIINNKKSSDLTADEMENKILEFEKNMETEQTAEKPEKYEDKNEDIISEINNEDEKIEKIVNAEVSENNENEDIPLESADDTRELQAAEAAIEDKISPHDTFRMIAEKFRHELDMLDEMGIIDKSVILGETAEKENRESTETSTKKEQNYGKKSWSEKITAAAVKDGKENNKDVVSNKNNGVKEEKDVVSEQEMLFKQNEKLNVGGGTLWVKADYREMYFIPSAIIELRKAFVKNGARNGNHIIAGKNKDKYYIGVPGSEDQRTTAEKNGYYDFLTVNESGRDGYWIKELEN